MAQGAGGGGDSPINITHRLKGVGFPARRDDLVERARANGAEGEVLDRLRAMPDQEFGTMADVMKAYGQTE
jgi:hypothetical protein